jgi:nucleotide-binding universal stress UspA family protein
MAATLLVGFDGTDGARAAAREAARLAGPLDASVVLVFGYSVSPLGGEVKDLAAAARERGQEVLGHGLDLLRAEGVEGTTELVDARPAEALTRLADALDARMIVVGSYGERPLKGAILGSTPHRLLHLSERPVLVVRA